MGWVVWRQWLLRINIFIQKHHQQNGIKTFQHTQFFENENS
jgi:hypothetical protein